MTATWEQALIVHLSKICWNIHQQLGTRGIKCQASLIAASSLYRFAVVGFFTRMFAMEFRVFRGVSNHCRMNHCCSITTAAFASRLSTPNCWRHFCIADSHCLLDWEPRCCGCGSSGSFHHKKFATVWYFWSRKTEACPENLFSILWRSAHSTVVGAWGDPSKIIRSDDIFSGIGWPPASSSNKMVLPEDSGGGVSAVTSPSGVSVRHRIGFIDREGMKSTVIHLRWWCLA